MHIAASRHFGPDNPLSISKKSSPAYVSVMNLSPLRELEDLRILSKYEIMIIKKTLSSYYSRK